MTLNLTHELNAVSSIAYRDAIKYVKNPQRILLSLLFPLIFIGALGGSLDANIGQAAGYSFVAFTMTGVFAQTIFSTVAQGIISLVQDRENNLTQELFVAPVARYSIVMGKIFGEMLVASLQGIFILLLGVFLGVSMGPLQVIGLLLAALVAGILGGAFGVVVVSFFGDSKFINQIFPLIFFPQFFLGGVFSPIKELPIYLKVISRALPLTYVVDFARNIFYRGQGEASLVILYPLWTDALVILGFTVLCLVLGTKRISRIEKES